MKKLVNLTDRELRVRINRKVRTIRPGSFVIVAKNAAISGCLVATDITNIQHAKALLIPANQAIPVLRKSKIKPVKKPIKVSGETKKDSAKKKSLIVREKTTIGAKNDS